jgi:TonB-dependent SusC/RagA subfamily outer membrane receptor
MNDVKYRNNIPTVVDSTKRVRWRGIPEDKQPLIIVDGEALPENEKLESINPDIIQSVTVLKDASATKFYGEKAKNGAIIITTKKAKQ